MVARMYCKVPFKEKSDEIICSGSKKYIEWFNIWIIGALSEIANTPEIMKIDEKQTNRWTKYKKLKQEKKLDK